MARVRRSFTNHDCSGTALQATPEGCRHRANAIGSKVGFELAIDSIQFLPWLLPGQELGVTRPEVTAPYGTAGCNSMMALSGRAGGVWHGRQRCLQMVRLVGLPWRSLRVSRQAMIPR